MNYIIQKYFRPVKGLVNVAYFGFSFGFLMIRSLAVSLGAARIHSASRQPASSLYAAPSSSYGTEVLKIHLKSHKII